MFSLTWQGCHKTVSTLLLPFLVLPDPQICLQSRISGIIWYEAIGNVSIVILSLGQQTRMASEPAPHSSNFHITLKFSTKDVNNISEGRKVRSGYLPFRTNASTLPITPKRSSSSDVGTSSYRDITPPHI
ncbi:hypothetical protein TNCV_2683181 [Trichonephila clavipes]|nr:hypothetical protein TNCV_2683181 [Trichonephila clavipes]